MPEIKTKMEEVALSFKQATPLGSRGMAHFVLPLLIIVGVGLVGTYLVVSSSANSNSTAFGTQEAPPPATKAKNKTRVEINKRSDTAASFNGGQTQPAPDNSPAPPDPPVTTRSNADVTGTPRPIYTVPAYVPPPLGNISVITYLNDPKKPGFKNERLGGVKVIVKRTVGQNYCANRGNKTTATTNEVQYDKAQNLIHGTVNFIECNVGDYVVTLVGRKGYIPVKGTATKKTVTVTNDSMTTIKFILNKRTTRN